MNFVKSILAQIAPLDEKTWETLKQYLRMQKILKGENLMSPGDEPTHFSLIETGLFKISYIVGSNGKEVIKHFNGPGDFIGPYADYLRGQASRVSITALTDAQVCRLAFKDIEKLSNEISQWEFYRRKIAEFHYLLKEDKEYELLVNSAEQRYETFQAKFSTLEKDIPDYLVASYLNVTPSYLSTLKKRRNL